MSHSPISPMYSSGTALQRVCARVGCSSISRKRGLEQCTEITYVPLPFDLDPAFSFPVTTKPNSKIGLRLKDCFDANITEGVKTALGSDWVANPVVMETVEGAHVKIDDLSNTGKVIVQRAYYPGETVQLQTELTKDARGFTWGQLLSLIVCEQYKAAAQGDWPLAIAGELWENGLPPFDNVWVTAIRRSNGADGRVRWFPELEVRIPFKEPHEGQDHAA